MLIPAADLSEQISTAGMEASGTGTMKLALNGAPTIGTLDGANIEIRDAVGDENFFLFGLTVEQVAELRGAYDPDAIIERTPELRRVLALIESGVFNCAEAGIMQAIVHAIRSPHDPWVTAADFASLIAAQRRASAAFLDLRRWTRMSILNTAASGRFSTDRTMQDYNRDIWHLKPIEL
jgi:starch phosphorylase